jgi:hypothetical protein
MHTFLACRLCACACRPKRCTLQKALSSTGRCGYQCTVYHPRARRHGGGGSVESCLCGISVLSLLLLLLLLCRGTTHALREIVRSEGVLALWKGLGASLLGSGHAMIQFPVYESMKEWFAERDAVVRASI